LLDLLVFIHPAMSPPQACSIKIKQQAGSWGMVGLARPMIAFETSLSTSIETLQNDRQEVTAVEMVRMDSHVVAGNSAA